MRSKETVTSAQMKEIERVANENGLSYYQMMENAGTAAADYIIEQEKTANPVQKEEGSDGKPVVGKRVAVFCGKGNNGGDGFVVARKLREAGAEVTIILVEGEPKTEDAGKNKEICEAMNMDMLDVSENEWEDLAWEADFIVDAIYGTGFHGELREKARKTTRAINESQARVYALDMPSGLNSDDGTADRDTVNADATIAFHRLKTAHVLSSSERYCGRLYCADIGIRGNLEDFL